MLRDRFRRTHPYSSPAVPDQRHHDTQGWHGTDQQPSLTSPDWPLAVDLRADTLPDGASAVTSCPACGSGMAVEELDLVGRVARLTCGDCGLLRARRLSSLSPS